MAAFAKVANRSWRIPGCWRSTLSRMIASAALSYLRRSGLFAAKWGITTGAVARKRFGYVCVAMGLGLAIMGLASHVGVVCGA